MIRNQVQNFLLGKMYSFEAFEADHEVRKKKVFIKLQSLLEKALVQKYCKTKVQDEQPITKEQIKVFR